MVYVDNKVALRQLELANAALLSQSSLRVADGESLAKDGKFHPRVLTLVSSLSAVRSWPAINCVMVFRAVIIQSLSPYFVVSPESMALLGMTALVVTKSRR